MNTSPLLWDIFCRVIDNHGDLGVSWRLSCQLAQRGHRVRLWVDDASALAWMAPAGQPGVEVLDWAESAPPRCTPDQSLARPQADVWIEAFGCEIEPAFTASFVSATGPTGGANRQNLGWINLEYLTAEPYARRCHGLTSPVMHGPAAGMSKRFFYPGFTDGTGGLLREADLLASQARHDRTAWLASQGIDWTGERLVSLFCYEPPALPALLRTLASGSEPVSLLVTHGRAQAAVRQALLAEPDLAEGKLRIHWLAPLTQTDFDHLLWSCDLNCVRGEDSLVRALWAGQPLLWHIYPQDDGAHLVKLRAFLDWLQAPADLRQWHVCWNEPHAADQPITLPAVDWHRARQAVQTARDRLLAQPDLLTQLEQMVQAMRQAGTPDTPPDIR